MFIVMQVVVNKLAVNEQVVRWVICGVGQLWCVRVRCRFPMSLTASARERDVSAGGGVRGGTRQGPVLPDIRYPSSRRSLPAFPRRDERRTFQARRRMYQNAAEGDTTDER